MIAEAREARGNQVPLDLWLVSHVSRLNNIIFRLSSAAHRWPSWHATTITITTAAAAARAAAWTDAGTRGVFQDRRSSNSSCITRSKQACMPLPSSSSSSSSCSRSVDCLRAPLQLRVCMNIDRCCMQRNEVAKGALMAEP